MPAEAPGRLLAARPLFVWPPGLPEAMEGYRRILEAVHPLKPRHRAALPADVKALSLSLTAERGPGPRPNYLSEAASLSAYLHYFLPWNLLRLSRLLAGLDFNPPEGASILDLGSGPLTLPQALWLARPELRARKLRFVCLDQTGQALRAGRALFEALTGAEGLVWSIETVQAPAHKAPHEAFHCVAAANAVNELAGGRGQEGHQNLERLAELLAGRIGPRGRLLLVEPGTRLGGRLLSRLREVFLEEGLSTLAPCTHDAPCPMLAPRWRSWCHFSFPAHGPAHGPTRGPAQGAPGWLAALAREAGLAKERLSLSFLYMDSGREGLGESEPDEAGHVEDWGATRRRVLSARVVSNVFSLPAGLGGYACEGAGLRLLTFPRTPRGFASGSLLRADLPPPGQRDPKSGTFITPLEPEAAPSTTVAGNAAADAGTPGIAGKPTRGAEQSVSSGQRPGAAGKGSPTAGRRTAQAGHGCASSGKGSVPAVERFEPAAKDCAEAGATSAPAGTGRVRRARAAPGRRAGATRGRSGGGRCGRARDD